MGSFYLLFGLGLKMGGDNFTVVWVASMEMISQLTQ
jgi:hypothetical protein